MAELKHRPVTAYQELSIAGKPDPWRLFFWPGWYGPQKSWIDPENTLLIILFQFVVHINCTACGFLI